ncbi:hypothetical protein N0V83_006118 [Neocucurbitaria cava]|uniref:Major facilitator superfamily (MFS) profile domain-containing protein n=1 Tax=Neocucurbitaria cava TaxID=798079 RepID=A0A9W8Y877_9PLEO|nr:hypothetical protein N0V83_006118 [Neocucurbitaria cava]
MEEFGESSRTVGTLMISIYVLGYAFGPLVLAPLSEMYGGFITQNLGWRWAYWIMIMATGPLNILMFIFMRESNHPTILAKKTARLRKELGRDDLRSQLEMKLPPRQVLARSLVRPIKFLCKSPIILMVALYVSTVYGILYLMFTTIPMVFQDIYHFQTQYTGLAYIGLGVGMFTALPLMMKFNDKTVVRLREKNGGIFERTYNHSHQFKQRSTLTPNVI